MTRSRVPELPMTSVAEFRAAAWPVRDRAMVGRVVLDIYLTWAALGAVGILFVVALVGAVVGEDGSLPMAAIAGVLTGLLVWRVVRKLRSAKDVRQRVDTLSREVDARAAQGAIPVTPDGWQQQVPPPPHERTGSWL